jgi:hypothetical protein
MTPSLVAWLQGFLASEEGLTTAWVLLALGVVDAASGLLWLAMGRRYPEGEGKKTIRRFLPFFLFIDAALVATGLYGLHLHGVFS